MNRRWLAAVLAPVFIGLLAVGGWFGWRTWQGGDAGQPVAVQDVPADVGSGPETIETVQPEAAAIVTAGTTPMPQRVATLGLLNKRNGRARELTLKPGQAVRVGDVAVHLRACERTAPWEADDLTGAFTQVDVRGLDGRWRRVFSGWLYKERPNLNVVEHPIYDVWPKSCTMSFPATGPDTASLKAPASSAKKSPRAASPAPAEAAAPSDSAPPSNAL